MSDWPRCYFLDEELQWLLVVRPEDDAYGFVVAREGWLLLEARFEISGYILYDDFIQHFLAELRTDAFHRRFHEIAKTYAPEMPTYQDCSGRCPWQCARERLWETCFRDWAWLIPSKLRHRGCRMFLHDNALMAEMAKA